MTTILKPILGIYTRLRYHIQVERFQKQQDRPYLILMNHQTAFDQFFIAMAFSGPVYYIASEDLFSIGWISRVLEYLVAPIPFRKSTSDLAAMRICMRAAKEGGTIALAPEGNRTYSGKTEYIKPSITSLVKALKLPVAFFHIEGGYGVHPRWSDVIRKGRMRAYVSAVMEPEEYKQLSNEELYEIICRELYVDETQDSSQFLHAKQAEYLERAMYVCPFCGLSEFESQGDIIRCKHCEKEIRYLPDKRLEGVGVEFPFRYVADWYKHQCNFIRNLDLSPYTETPVYSDVVRFSENIYRKRKRHLSRAALLSVFADRLTVHTETEVYEFPFVDMTAATVLGKNKLNIYTDDHIFQCKGNERFNALKYLNLYCHAENIRKGDFHGEFLGL